MASLVVEQLEVNGPQRCQAMTPDEARAWCARLVRRQYENFSVLSAVVPPDRRDDFAAVYAFCRWADDLGDEIGDPERSLGLLAWWREELDRCYEGAPRHPVFVALRPTIERFDLPREPFADLVDAFEQDQRVRRYATWAELIDYCRRSANPVGRLVLMMCEEPPDGARDGPRDDDRFGPSDDLCTALQLVNHWQDVRRDAVERDRIYLPRELMPDPARFESELLASARQGWAVNHTFLAESCAVVKTCCERTWTLFESGSVLLERVGPRTRPIVWLLAAGGRHVLRLVELWNHETALHRPRLGAGTRAALVARAWWLARRANAGAPGATR